MTARATLIVTAAFVALSIAGGANAQDAPPAPRVEVGLDAAVSSADTAGYDVRRSAGPRVALHLTRDLSLTFAADVSRTPGDGRFQPRDEASSASVQLRRTMVQRGRATLDLLVGSGVQTHQTTWPAYEYTVGDYSFAVPEWVNKETSLLADFGFGSRQHINRYVTLREDFIVRLAATSEYRAQFGVDVPLGGRTLLAHESARFGSARLGTGDRVWIELADRSQVTGRLERVSADRLELVTATGRRAIVAAEIDRIDVPDSPVEGMWRGTAIGVGGGVGLAALASWAFCEGSCEPPETALVLLGGALWGGGLGALIGALSDSLHVGQRTVYQRAPRSSWSIAPVVTRQATGVGTIVRW